MAGLEVHVEHIVDRSPTDVWAFVVDGFFANHPKWDPALIECRPLDGSAVPPQAGTRGVEVRAFGGKQRAEFEVTEVDRGRYFAFRNTSGPFALERSYTFAPVERGTRVAFSFRMLPKGAMKFVFPLLRGTVREQVRTNIARLARLLDA